MKNKKKEIKKTISPKPSKCHNNSVKSLQSPLSPRYNFCKKNEEKEGKKEKINLSLKEVFYKNLNKFGESFPYDKEALNKKRKLSIDIFGHNNIGNTFSNDSYYSATSPKTNYSKNSIPGLQIKSTNKKVNPVLLTKKEFIKVITNNFDYSFSKYINKQIIKKN